MSNLASASHWARVSPDAPALLFDDVRWSWLQLELQVQSMLRGLLVKELEAGQRIGVLAGNAPEVVPLVHAASRVGASLVLLNTRLADVELHEQIRRSKCRAVVASAEERARLNGLDGVDIWRLSELAKSGEHIDRGDDGRWPLTLMFTSGTTGRAKAAMLGLAQHRASAFASARHLALEGPELHLLNLPLFHVGGLAMLFRAAHSGGAVRLHSHFSAEAVLRDLRELPVTHVSLVATTLARLLDANGPHPLPGAVKALLIGGGPLPEPTRRRCEQSGIATLATYGLTEAASQVTTVTPSERSRLNLGSGRALPGTLVRIVDEARRPLSNGTVGEIEVRGPTVMLGYADDEAATRAALADDGWLRTRDLGELDADGFLTVHARRSDLILSGGENVYPAEVESVLLAAPGVLDAAVIAREDSTWGQVPVAALVLETGASLARVEAHLVERLARFKRPRTLHVLAQLPRTASGKIDRPALSRALSG